MKRSLFSLFILLACGQLARAQALPFFSGAEGYGGTFLGAAPTAGWFSNATVYHVTNLNDSGAGSFRGAFAENTANRIIVFDVGGVINLTSDSLDIKNINNYYIAGQTAPSPVTIYGDTSQITHSSNRQQANVILRYLTFRKGTGDGQDAITFAGGGANAIATNVILDHVSGSWSEDEILSVTNYNTNVTVQYSIIADALVNNHAYGSLIRPKNDANVTYHHNLYANNASRQARFGTYDAFKLTADFRNNVIYNWRDRPSYAGGSSEPEQEFVDVNYVGNYLVAGPATVANLTKAFTVDKNVDVRAYQSGNFIDSDKQVNPSGQPNGTDTGWSQWQLVNGDNSLVQMATPFATAPVTTQSAIDAYNQVINHVGNFWWAREAIDARIINNVKNNTNPPSGVAASGPNAAELAALLATPMSTRPAGYDTDNDGMPDVWEVAHGLNPNDANDWKLDFDTDGYINLLEYINELGEFPAPAPVVFNGSLNSRYAHILNWKTSDGVTPGSNWQPSRFDEAHINSGTVAVDAAGQHARLLKLGNTSGGNATLNITAGWLDVTQEIVIGAHATATAALNLSGGTLNATKITIGSGDAFNFTGGQLHVGEVVGDLTNNGGTLAPGNSIGTTHITGNLALTAGKLQLEITSGAIDGLLVDGSATLGGTLDIDMIGGYTGSFGDSFLFLVASSVGGTFTTLDLPTLGGGLVFWLNYNADNVILRITAILAGDANNDGIVNASDTLTVEQHFGATGANDGLLLGDANDDGKVDGADYLFVQQNLGQQWNGIPEPGTAALLLTLSMPLLRGRRQSI